MGEGRLVVGSFMSRALRYGESKRFPTFAGDHLLTRFVNHQFFCAGVTWPGNRLKRYRSFFECDIQFDTNATERRGLRTLP